MAKKIRKDSSIASLAFILVSCVLCLAQLTNTATAAIYYVDPVAGNDLSTGTSAAPWQTIDHAESESVNGSTVYLRSGNYGEVKIMRTGVSRSSWADAITFQPQNGHKPIFNKLDFEGFENRYLIFRNIDIIAPDSSNYGDAVVFVDNSSHIKIIDCNVIGRWYDVNGPGTLTAAGISMQGSISDDPYVTDVLIEGCDVQSANKGIEAAGDVRDDIILRNNHVHKVVSSIIGIYPNPQNNGIILIEGNHIHDRRYYAGAHGSGIALRGNNITVRNNIIHDFGGSGSIRFYGVSNNQRGHNNMLIENNLIYDGQGTTNLSLQYLESNITVRNNTVIGYYQYASDGQATSILTNKYGSAMGLDANDVRFPPTNIKVYNNIFVGSVGTGETWSTWRQDVKENNNIFWSFQDGWDGKTYLTSPPGDGGVKHSIIIMSSGNIGNPDYFEGSGNFFVGGTLFDLYSYKRVYHEELGFDSSHRMDLSAAYRLGSTSPAINFGNLNYAPATDIFGRQRVGTSNAGCYEYTSSQSSNNPPNADAGSDQTVTDSDQSGSEQITLDGSGSSDTDGSIVSYVWYEGGNQIATGVKPTVSLPVGRHTITLKVTNNSGLTDTDTVIITVEAEEGLVGDWKFGESSGSYASDSSGYSITGRLLNGPLWTNQGEIGFDGNNDAVEINTATLNINSGTVALWVNPRDFSKSKHYLFGHLTQPANNRIQLFCNASGTLGVGLGNNASTNTNIYTLNTQEWYHIALTWNSTSYAVFVDGQQKASGEFSGISNMQTYADIGNSGNRSQLSEAFNGFIDEVRLYNRALNADEIANHALVFLPIGNKTIDEGETLTFPVKTKFGTIVEILDSNLPYSPSFTSNIFTWTPDYNDAGTYEVEFAAPHTSGAGEDYERITVTVTDTQQQNPVGNWKFNESSGDIASDSSTTGNTGYLRNGLAWGTGKHSRAVMFSVPNDAVEIQTTKMNPQFGTIAMWVYMNKQTMDMHYLFGHASPTLTNRIQLYLKYGNLCLGLGDSHETSTDIQQLQNKKWYHIALTWSKGTYNVYVNGSLKANGTYSGLTGFSDYADIGNNGITREKAFNGSIDDALIYNRSLDAAEIAQLAI